MIDRILREKIGKFMNDWLWNFIPDKGDNWIIAESQLWGIIDQLLAEERERILKELPQNPYPEWLFPMTTKEYVKAIPNEKLRGAISGYAGRWVWDNCIKSVEEIVKED